MVIVNRLDMKPNLLHEELTVPQHMPSSNQFHPSPEPPQESASPGGSTATSRLRDSKKVTGRCLAMARERAGITANYAASKVQLSPSALSQIEHGVRSLPAELLPVLARLYGFPCEQLLGAEPASTVADGSFDAAIRFLSDSRELGLSGIAHDRESGLRRVLPFIQGMQAGSISITGSSLRGLQQYDSSVPFAAAMRAARERGVEVRVLVTHLERGQDREKLEDRPEGSIPREIQFGVEWLYQTEALESEDAIKFVKASPSMFSVFAKAGVRGVGLVNPYPTMLQGFASFCLILRRIDLPGESAAHLPLFDQLLRSNFEEPWGKPAVTATLAEVVAGLALTDSNAGFKKWYESRFSKQAKGAQQDAARE